MATTSIETYFWMVDRLKIEDDTKNKVNRTTNSVNLSKVFVKKIENGFFIGKLLNEMYPTYSKRSEKSFTIPTEISELNPKLDEYDRQTWNLLFEVLENYGVELSKKKIEIIMTTYKSDILLDIIDCLFEIDNSSTGQISAAMKRKLDIKGTFGTERKS